MIGSVVEALVSEKTGDKCFGKASNDSAITFVSADAKLGDFVKVKITNSRNANLTGEVYNG